MANSRLANLGEAFGIADAVDPMKAKQVPDNFHDWIEARTFEIGAEMALPSPAAPGLFGAGPYWSTRNSSSHGRNSSLNPMPCSVWNVAIRHGSICFSKQLRTSGASGAEKQIARARLASLCSAVDSFSKGFAIV